ncbi:hypothetical protein L6R53_10855 [Myxococcota bacterium]|nr:hypothetical protein [Myxococcota bacterium]
MRTAPRPPLHHTGSHTPVTWHTGPFPPVSVTHTVPAGSSEGPDAVPTEATATVKADRRLAGRSAIRSALRRGLAQAPRGDRSKRADRLRGDR